MKKSILLTATLALLVPLGAQAACENVKADITRKIVASGQPKDITASV